MSVVNPPLVPIGLRELVKHFTKDLLSNKPQNIAEYAVKYFEKMAPEKPYDVKGFELYGYGEAIAKIRKQNHYPISAVFAIFPQPLTQIIKEFIKATLRENPHNLIQFAIEYFRQVKEENKVVEVDYSSYINYTNNKTPLKVGQSIKCTCGRTLTCYDTESSSNKRRHFNENNEKKRIGKIIKNEDDGNNIKKINSNADIVVNNQLIKSVRILQRFFRLKLKKRREEDDVTGNKSTEKTDLELLATVPRINQNDILTGVKNQFEEENEERSGQIEIIEKTPISIIKNGESILKGELNETNKMSISMSTSLKGNEDKTHHESTALEQQPFTPSIKSSIENQDIHQPDMKKEVQQNKEIIIEFKEKRSSVNKDEAVNGKLVKRSIEIEEMHKPDMKEGTHEQIINENIENNANNASDTIEKENENKNCEKNDQSSSQDDVDTVNGRLVKRSIEIEEMHKPDMKEEGKANTEEIKNESIESHANSAPDIIEKENENKNYEKNDQSNSENYVDTVNGRLVKRSIEIEEMHKPDMKEEGKANTEEIKNESIESHANSAPDIIEKENENKNYEKNDQSNSENDVDTVNGRLVKRSIEIEEMHKPDMKEEGKADTKEIKNESIESHANNAPDIIEKENEDKNYEKNDQSNSENDVDTVNAQILTAEPKEKTVSQIFLTTSIESPIKNQDVHKADIIEQGQENTKTIRNENIENHGNNASDIIGKEYAEKNLEKKNQSSSMNDEMRQPNMIARKEEIRNENIENNGKTKSDIQNDQGNLLNEADTVNEQKLSTDHKDESLSSDQNENIISGSNENSNDSKNTQKNKTEIFESVLIIEKEEEDENKTENKSELEKKNLVDTMVKKGEHDQLKNKKDQNLENAEYYSNAIENIEIEKNPETGSIKEKSLQVNIKQDEQEVVAENVGVSESVSNKNDSDESIKANKESSKNMEMEGKVVGLISIEYRFGQEIVKNEEQNSNTAEELTFENCSEDNRSENKVFNIQMQNVEESIDDREENGNDEPLNSPKANSSVDNLRSIKMEISKEENVSHPELHAGTSNNEDGIQNIVTTNKQKMEVDNENIDNEIIEESQDKVEIKIKEYVEKTLDNTVNKFDIETIHGVLGQKQEANKNDIMMSITENLENEKELPEKLDEIEETQSEILEVGGSNNVKFTLNEVHKENKSKKIIMKGDSEISFDHDKHNQSDEFPVSEIKSEKIEIPKTDSQELGNKISSTIETIIKDAKNFLASSYSSDIVERSLQQVDAIETEKVTSGIKSELSESEEVKSPPMATEEQQEVVIEVKESIDISNVFNVENEENFNMKSERLSLDSSETVDIESLYKKNMANNKLEIDQETEIIVKNEQLQKLSNESESDKSEISTIQNMMKDNDAVCLDKSIKNENIQEVIQSSENYEKNESDIESIVKLSENKFIIDSQKSIDNNDVYCNDHLKNLDYSSNSVENKLDSTEGQNAKIKNFELNSIEKHPTPMENSDGNDYENVATPTPNLELNGGNNVSEYSIEQRINKDYVYTVGDLQLPAEKAERILDVILESPPYNEVETISDDAICHDALNQNASQFSSNKQLYDIMEENLPDDIKESQISSKTFANKINDNSRSISTARDINEKQEHDSWESKKQDSTIENQNRRSTDKPEIVDNNNDEIMRISNILENTEHKNTDEESNDNIQFGVVNSSEDELVFSNIKTNQQKEVSVVQIDDLHTPIAGPSHNLEVIKNNNDSSLEDNSYTKEFKSTRQNSKESGKEICHNTISTDLVNDSDDLVLLAAAAKNEDVNELELNANALSLENDDENDELAELQNLKPRSTRELLRSNTDSVIKQLPDPEAFIKAQQNDISMDVDGDENEDGGLFDKMFSLEGEMHEKIRQKMFACSLSETNSDSFDVVVDQIDGNCSQPRPSYNDENIETALVNVSGNSTDTESTIVSAATKIQANARGYLTRQRLRRESHGTKSSAQDEQKASFGNAAINESLENLVKDAAAKKIQKFLRKIHQNRSNMQSTTTIEGTGKTDDSTTSSSEYSLAARRMTLQRGDALRNDSLPDEENSLNDSSQNKNNVQLKRVNVLAKTYVNTSTDRRLMWQLIRRNSMPVQIHTDVFRVVPKHMKKRVSSAEFKTKSSINFLNE